MSLLNWLYVMFYLPHLLLHAGLICLVSAGVDATLDCCTGWEDRRFLENDIQNTGPD